MVTEKQKLTEREHDAIESVIEKLSENGTLRPYYETPTMVTLPIGCPKCGGKVVIMLNRASYSVACETGGCFGYAVRGL